MGKRARRVEEMVAYVINKSYGYDRSGKSLNGLVSFSLNRPSDSCWHDAAGL